MLYFVTGSKNKFEEAKAILPELVQVDLDLPEIQDSDPQAIIRAKLEAAVAHQEGEFVVEDTSLYMEALNGLPGPLIKWFMKTIGIEGLSKIADAFGNDRASARTIVGYAKSNGEVAFFEGEVRGRIVKPIGSSNFGWDPIFLPDGHEHTFAEMAPEEKNEVSMRRIAFERFAANR